MSKKILTVTLNPAIDKSTSVDHIKTDDKLRCANPHYDPGGGGINVSRAIRKLGGNTCAMYAKGGATGELFKQLLEEESIDQLPVECEGWTRENLVVLEQSSNSQYRFVMPGNTLKEEEWQAFLNKIEKEGDFDYVVASGSLPQGVPEDFYLRLVRTAKKTNTRFILDTAVKQSLNHAIKEGAFLIKPNLKELSVLAGKPLHDIREQEKAAKEIVDNNEVENLVVSLGPAGAMLVNKEGVYNIPAPSVPKKSTVGAGDSMVGGILYSLAEGYNTEEAVRFGVACGSAATLNTGTHLFNKEDVDNLYAYMTEKA